MTLQFVLADGLVLSVQPQQCGGRGRTMSVHLPTVKLRLSDYGNINAVERAHTATKTTGPNIDTAGHPCNKSNYGIAALGRLNSGKLSNTEIWLKIKSIKKGAHILRVWGTWFNVTEMFTLPGSHRILRIAELLKGYEKGILMLTTWLHPCTNSSFYRI